MTASRAEILRAVPPSARPLALSLLEVAERDAAALYLVGGPVRDWLLGRPIRDVDLLLEADGESRTSAESLARSAAGPAMKVVAHQRFGTVTVQGEGFALDLSLARAERYAHDGALPSVEAGSLEDDLRRRDFTANALALPLSRVARRRHRNIVELPGGLADLEARRLRVIHDRSFHDDPTRALRAARLAPRLGFTLLRSSRNAMRDALRDGAFGRVSGDRLRRELAKLFEDAALGLDPARALRLLDEWHVLGALEPGLSLPRDAGVSLRRLGRFVAAPTWPQPRWRPWVAGTLVWLAAVEPALRGRALRRFGVRGAVFERVVSWPRLRDRRLRALRRQRGRGVADAALRGLTEEELVAFYATAEASLQRRVARFASEDRYRKPPLRGSDLVALGASGPAVGRALEAVRAAYLDGKVRDREEALAFAQELLRGRARR